MGWAEQTDGYKLDITEEGQSGSRVFQTTPSGTDTLPSLGDSFNASYPDCKAVKLSYSLYGNKVGNDRVTVDYEYRGVTYTIETAYEDLLRTLDVSGEFQNIGRGTRTWTAGGSVEQDLFRRIITATIKIPKVYGSFNSILNRIKQAAGKVNSTTMFGQEEGQIMCIGGSSTEFITSTGSKRWRVEWVFEMRAPLLAGGSYGGWNHVFNETTQAFDTTDPLVYESANLKNILF